jgi:hypothetical protein
MTRFSRIAALTACLTLAASAGASADAGDHDALPAGAKVVNVPERLSVAQANTLRARIDRTRRFPAAPRLVNVGRARLVRARQARVTPPVPAAGPGARMFGSESAYAYKRDAILGSIQNFNATNVPRHGGRYVPPALYELADGAQLYGCNGSGVYNGAYCPWANTLGWSMTWTQNAFARSGDMKWATLIAHEYGHAAQNFLNIRGGWMQYTQYSEGFADCMAGAFFLWAYNGRITDTVGRGDGNEFRDAFVALQSNVTTLNTHGTFDWRYALALYGWNTGFDGCVNWARSIDGA